MSTIFFCLTVGVLIPLLPGSNGTFPPLPHTGVRLYGGYNKTSYPNNSLIPANYFYGGDQNTDGLNDALWCQSARNESNIGVWYYPNGTQVSTVDDSSPLHSVHKSGQIGLYRNLSIGNYEGIYTCVIPDECNVNQTLIVLLYTKYTYQINRGPKIIETTFKSLLSTRDHSSFLISFIVTNGTTTYINCTLNDTLIYPNITQIILSYQLPTKTLVELLFQSRDEGWYNCSVSNSRVEDEYFNNKNQAYPDHNYIYVKVARKPVNVTAKWINSSDVLVTWSPPVNNNPLIDGYEVFYGVNDCDCKTISVGVTTYSELIISGLCSSQNYSFFVVSRSNENNTLSSEWSDVYILNTVNEITMIIIPSPSSQSNDCNCREKSQAWFIVGVVFLFFTNLITVVVLIISCLWLLRRKYEKFEIMKTQREYTGQYLSSRDGTTAEIELKDENLHLKDNNNEKESNPYSSHVYAVVNKKRDNNESKPTQSTQNILQPIYSVATTGDMNDMNDDEMTVQLSGSNYVNVKEK